MTISVAATICLLYCIQLMDLHGGADASCGPCFFTCSSPSLTSVHVDTTYNIGSRLKQRWKEMHRPLLGGNATYLLDIQLAILPIFNLNHYHMNWNTATQIETLTYQNNKWLTWSSHKFDYLNSISIFYPSTSHQTFASHFTTQFSD